MVFKAVAKLGHVELLEKSDSLYYIVEVQLLYCWDAIIFCDVILSVCLQLTYKPMYRRFVLTYVTKQAFFTL